MRVIFKSGALVAVMVVGLSGQAAGFPIKISDDRNKAIVVTERPRRIVSLAPTNTELLFALGLDKEIVADTAYCDHPEAAKNKLKVGGFSTSDVDRICALQPDLILAFGTLQLPVVEALEKRGKKVFWLYPRSINDILGSFERVGQITGAVREARQLRDAVEKEINVLRSALGDIPEEKRPSVFRVMSFNRPATIGAESFQSDLFSLAGGRNAFPYPGKDYFELEDQELVKRDPDVVLVCGDDEQGLKQKLKEHPVYRNLTAVKKDSVLVMPCDLTCKPGPRIAEAARKMARYLHPEWERTIKKGSRPAGR